MLCFIPLSYLCTTTYFGVFHYKITSFYEMHPNRTTDNASLLFSATYAAQR